MNRFKSSEDYKQSVYLIMDAIEKSNNKLKTAVLVKDLEDTIESFKREVAGDNFSRFHSSQELSDEQLSAGVVSLVGQVM